MTRAPSALTACLVALLLGLGACAERARPLVLWHSYRGAEEAALLAVVDAYRQRSDLPIEVLGVPNEALASKLASAIPRGHGPDLFIFAHERVGGWVRGGLLAPATHLDAAALLPETLPPLEVGGQRWGYPLAFKSLALFRHKGLSEAPPEDTEGFFTHPVPARAFALGYQAGGLYFHAPFLFGAGAGSDAGGLLEPSGAFDFEAPEVLDSFAFVARAASAGLIPAEPSGATITELFNAGRLAYVINGPWFAGEIAPGVPYAVHPLPPFVSPRDGQRRPSRPFLTVEAAFVSAHARHPEAAHALAAALTEAPAAHVRAVTGRQAVATAATWAAPAVEGGALLGAFLAQLPDTVPMDNRPEMQLVWEPGDLALKQLLRGRTPAEAARAAARRYRAVQSPSGGRGPPSPADPLPWLVLLGGATALALVAARRLLRRPAPPRDPAAPRVARWILPAVIATGVLVIVPFLVGLGLAFFHHEGGQWTFIGGNNFVDILGSRHYGPLEPLSFYYALLVTVLWTGVNVALHLGIGFGLALLLNRPLLALKPIYRVLLVLPWAVPSYITALIWRGLFHSQLGAINGLLGLLGLDGVAWFDSFGTAFFANVCANAWLGFPFMMVISLGALQAIPRDLLEAAAVDGAGAWQRFRHITLPLVKPALVPAVLLGVVWTFNQFNIIYLVSAGAPDNATDILISEAYRWAFARREQYGYAAAYAALIFLILLLWARYSMRVSRRIEGADTSEPAPQAVTP